MLTIKKLPNFDQLKASLSNKINPTFFQTLDYQKIFAKNFCSPQDLVLLGIYNQNQLACYGSFEKVNDKLLFLGMKPVITNEELTDYGDIYLDEASHELFYQAWTEILNWCRKNNLKQIQLDYVRENSLSLAVFKTKQKLLGNVRIKIAPQEVAPFIELPSNWEEYFSSLKRVKRKELKRKIRRLETIENIFWHSNKEIREIDFEEFVRLHRLSDTNKEKFMSKKMKKFFWDLILRQNNNWQTNLCFLKIDNQNVSSLLTFENKNQVLAYNSGYNPKFGYYSVGLLLHAFKIKQVIETGKKIYDFLRGDERYKYDLGAKEIKLYRINLGI